MSEINQEREIECIKALDLINHQMKILNETYFILEKEKHNTDLILNNLTNDCNDELDSFHECLIKKHLDKLLSLQSIIESKLFPLLNN